MTHHPIIPAAPKIASWLSETNEVTRTFLSAGGIEGMINLGGGLPDPATYPVVELADLARNAVADHAEESLAYGPIEGLHGLRETLARRYSNGPLVLGPENVMITSGGMQALDLLGKLFADPGSLIAAQSPTYLGALDAWRPRQPVYRPMHMEALAAEAEANLTGACFAYSVPNFSNPTGALVDIADRRALVAAARRTGTPLVEDDPYGSLFYDGLPLPRIIALDAEACEGRPYDGPVIYLGTVSKQLAPGLRIGWVIAAPQVIAALTVVKQGSDLASSSLTQQIVRSAMETGLIDRALPRILDIYRPRRDALCAALNRHLSEHFTFARPVGGMFVWLTAKSPTMNTDDLMRAGLDEGVCIAPGSVFDPLGKDFSGVRLNFTANPPDRLEEGVRRIADTARRLT